MTPKEFHAYLVRLAMEAFDFAAPDVHPWDRAQFERKIRERMAQAAQVIACERFTHEVNK